MDIHLAKRPLRLSGYMSRGLGLAGTAGKERYRPGAITKSPGQEQV